MLHQVARPVLRRAASMAARGSCVRFMSASPWKDLPMGPPDPIIGLADAFRADDFPQKVIVGVGAYRDDQGKPEVLPCVREAEKTLMESNLDHEYSGIVSRVAWCLSVT